MIFSKLKRAGMGTLVMISSAGMLNSVNCGTGLGEKLVNNVNPCGSVLNCNPLEWELMFNDFPDWELDPTCTIPGACGEWPPLEPVGAAGNP